MNHDVTELIDLGAAMAPDVFAQLGAITARATGDGVEVQVDLDGRLVGLELSPQALAAGPAPLAASIFRLTQQASAAALNRGIEVLAPVVGEELADELRSLALPAPESVPPPAEEDFSKVESWALPR